MFHIPPTKNETKIINACVHPCRSVRLFSTKSFKALGTLIYHKAAVQALVFARAYPAVARPHHHHFRHHRHPRDPAKIAKSGAGGSVGNVGVPNTYILADTREPGRSGDDDDDGGDAGADVDAVDHDDDKIAVDNDDNDDQEEGGGEEEGDDEDDDMSAEEKARRSRWLVSGDKDGRVVVWALTNFTSEGHQKERAP